MSSCRFMCVKNPRRFVHTTWTAMLIAAVFTSIILAPLRSAFSGTASYNSCASHDVSTVASNTTNHGNNHQSSSPAKTSESSTMGFAASALVIADAIWYVYVCLRCKTTSEGVISACKTWRRESSPDNVPVKKKEKRILTELPLLCVDVIAATVVTESRMLLVTTRVLRLHKLSSISPLMTSLRKRFSDKPCHRPVYRLAILMVGIAIMSHVAACVYVIAGCPPSLTEPCSWCAATVNKTSAVGSISDHPVAMNWARNIYEGALTNANINASSYHHGNGTSLHNNSRVGSPIQNMNDFHALLYLRALYMAMQSLLTVGFGDSPPRSPFGYALVVSLSFAGTITYALMIACLTSIFTNVAAVSNTKRMVSEAVEYLEHRRVPQDFKKKITRYLYHVGHRLGGMVERDIESSCYTPNMRARAIQHRAVFLEHNVPLFKAAGKKFCLALAEVASSETFMENDMLCVKNEARPEIIVLLSGSAEAFVSLPRTMTADSKVKTKIDAKIRAMAIKTESMEEGRARLDHHARGVLQNYHAGSTIGMYKTFFRGHHAVGDCDVRATAVCSVLRFAQVDVEKILVTSDAFSNIRDTLSAFKSGSSSCTIGDNAGVEVTEARQRSTHVLWKAFKQVLERHKTLDGRTKTAVASGGGGGGGISGGGGGATAITSRRVDFARGVPKDSSVAARGAKASSCSISDLCSSSWSSAVSNGMLTGAVLWCAIFIPARAAFASVGLPSQIGEGAAVVSSSMKMFLAPKCSIWSMVLDYTCDAIFIHRFVRNNMKKKNSSNQLQAMHLNSVPGSDLRARSCNPSTSWLKCFAFLAILFPYDLFVATNSSFSPDVSWQMWTALRLPKILLVFPFSSAVARNFYRILILCITRGKINNTDAKSQFLSAREEVLGRITATVVLTIHWISCAFQYVHKEPKYVRALYWTTAAVSTTGFGEIVPRTKMECVFGVAAMFAGVTVFAALIAGLAALQSARITPHSSKYRSRVLGQFCTSLEISEAVRGQVLAYDEYRSTHVGDIDESRLLEDVIPAHYKTELRAIQGLALLKHPTSIFRICSDPFQRMIAEYLCACVAVAGEAIVSPDGGCLGLYILVSGVATAVPLVTTKETGKEQRVETTTNMSGKEHTKEYKREAKLSPPPNMPQNVLVGECVAEFALFDGIEQAYTIKAIEDCELLLLRRADFDAITEHLQDLRSRLKNIVASDRNKKQTESCAEADYNEGEDALLQSTQQEVTSRRSMCKFFAGMLTTMVLLVYLYSIPFQASFLVHWDIPVEIVALDTVAYVILIAGEWYQLSSSESVRAEDEDGNYPSKAQQCRRWICEERGFVDLVALLPWELLYKVLLAETIGPLQAYSLLRLPKLLLYHRWEQFAKALEPVKAAFVRRCNEKVSTLCALVLLFTTCSHAMACVWFSLAAHAVLDPDTVGGVTWASSFFNIERSEQRGALLPLCALAAQGGASHINNINNTNNNSFTMTNGTVPLTPQEEAYCVGLPSSVWSIVTWYTSSMYYIFITLTTVGYGDIVAVNTEEYIFTIFLIFLGTFILVFLLAKLEKIVANIDVASTLANRKTDILHEYGKLRNLPEKMQLRINEYADLVWAQRCGATFSETMSYLGDRQRVCIVLEKVRPILEKNPVFKTYGQRTAHQLARCMQLEVLLAGQILFKAEEISDPFYILVDGVIELLKPSSDTVKKSGPGAGAAGAGAAGAGAAGAGAAGAGAAGAGAAGTGAAMTGAAMAGVAGAGTDPSPGATTSPSQRTSSSSIHWSQNAAATSIGSNMSDVSSSRTSSAASTSSSSFWVAPAASTPKRRKRRKAKSSRATVYMTVESPSAVCTETYFIREPRPCTARGRTSCQLFSLRHAEMIACLQGDKVGWQNHQQHEHAIVAELQKMSLVKTMKKNLASKKLMKMQQEELGDQGFRVKKAGRFMCAPHNTYRLAWSFVILALLLADVVVLPLRLAFSVDETVFGLEGVAVAVGTAVDCVHMFHIYLCAARFSVFNHADGTLVRDLKTVFKRYASSAKFPMDIFVAFPVQLCLYLGRGAAAAQTSNDILSAITRLPKVVHFVWNGGAFWTEIEREVLGRRFAVDLQDGRFRATKMGACVLIVTHVVACLFLSHSDAWQQNAFVGNRTVVESDPISKYLVGSYWASYTISTVGYGNIQLDHSASLMFAMGVSLLGTILCGAGITAILTNYLDGLDQTSGLSRLKQRCVDMLLTAQGFPYSHRREAQEYLAHLSRDQKSVDEAQVFPLLSSTLKTELLCHFTLEPVKKLLAAQQWESEGLLRSLCQCMRSYVATPLEELVKRGTTSERMFVLISGKVAKHGCGNHQKGVDYGAEITVSEGEAFGGEHFDSISPYSAVCVRMSHLFYVPRDRFEEIRAFVRSARRSTAKMRVSLTTRSNSNVLQTVRRGSFGGARQLKILSETHDEFV